MSDVGDGWGDAGDERLDNNTPTNDVDDDEYKQPEGDVCTGKLLVRVHMAHGNCAVQEQLDYAVSSSAVATNKHLSTDADVSSALMATPPAK